MKTCILAFMATLTLSLYESQTAIAQWTPLYGSVTQGMFGYRAIGMLNTGTATTGIFGYRTVGAPLVQGPGNFTSNIQFSPYGGYVLNNPSYGYQVVAPNPASGPWYSNNMMAYPFAPELTYPSNPGTNVGEGNGPTVQGYPTNPGVVQENTNLGAMQPGTNFGTMTAGVSNVTPQRARFQTASVISARPQRYTRSPELSNRLTMIARDKGMLMGKGINVYLSNDIALLQGTVRTPGDRDVLANVLGLEPEVEHIDNRLAVGATGN